MGPKGKSRGPPVEITWAPRGNHVGPQRQSLGPPVEITWDPRGLVPFFKMLAGTRLLGPKYQDQAGGPAVQVVGCPSGVLLLPASALTVRFHSQCPLLTTQKLGPLRKNTKPCAGNWVGGVNSGPERGS